MDTAGVISNCDYVVTSDSAIAHLSSAMGKQTYVALSCPEWRWGLTEERSIWYSKCYLIVKIYGVGKRHHRNQTSTYQK